MNFLNTSLTVNKEWKPGDLLSIETAVNASVTALIVKEGDIMYLVDQSNGELLHLRGAFIFSSSQSIKDELHDYGIEVTHFSSEDFSLEIKLRDYTEHVVEHKEVKEQLQEELSSNKQYNPSVGLYNLETGERIDKPLSYYVYEPVEEEEEAKPSALESSRRFLEERKKQVKELADLYNIPDLKDFGPKTLEAVKQSLRDKLTDPVPATEEDMQSVIYSLSVRVVALQKELDELKAEEID